MSMPALFKDRLSIPVIGAPLFIISVPDLVIAQCKAGVVGSFPALNARPPALLDEWLVRIKEELAAYDKAHPERPSAPFAVNQIVHRSNNRHEQDLAVCEKHKVPMMITSLGAREELNQAAHGWGGIVFHDVINQKFAHKAIEKGADGLILVSAGAGGHAGEISPFAFVAETRQWFDGPIALSGAIANGRAIRAARILGADFAYIGSAFIATAEANAVEGYKQMMTNSGAEDIVYSNLFTGVHGNYLKRSIRPCDYFSPSPLVGEGGAKRRMRGLYPRRGLYPPREPLTRLRFAKPPSPTRGERKKAASSRKPLMTRQTLCHNDRHDSNRR